MSPQSVPLINVSVLLVDDHPNVLESLYFLLTSKMRGAIVDRADSGRAALERIVATDYDVVVSDIVMPGMNGLELLERIQAVRPNTPTVLMTGFDERKLIVQALRAGAYDFIQKPIDHDYFLATVTRAVLMRRLSCTVEEQKEALERHAAELERIVQERTQTLRESERRLNQLLEDRERISRDLHDNIIQMLYAIGLGLEESQRLLGEDPQTASSNLGHAVKELNAVIRDVRSYIAWSEPKVSDGRQLKAAIERLARTMEGTHLLHFRLKVDQAAADRLTPEEASHVLYIAREAMSNSLRHSQARDGIVVLQVRDENICLTVADAGDGFDTTDTGRYGQGLRNMAVRAQKLDARLQIISEPGLGVRIMLDIPVVRKHASA